MERARAVYATLGHSDALALALEPGEHGWNAGLIEASVAWMRRWLDAEEGATPFVELMLPSAVESRVSPEGQVLLLEGERSIHSGLAAEAGRLRGGRRQRALAQRLTRARERVALPALADIEVPRIEERASTTEGALVIERSWLVWQDGTRLPAARVRPAEGASEETIDLVLDEDGVEAVLTRYETHGLPTGRRAFVLDPACLGDARPWERQRYYSVFGPEANDAVLCHLLGRPLVGRQAAQILGAARALEGEGPLELSARGRAVLPALHAAGLEPGLFDVVRIAGELPSYSALFERNNLQLEFGSLVHGALRDYELADLAVAAGVIESTEDEHGHVQH